MKKGKGYPLKGGATIGILKAHGGKIGFQRLFKNENKGIEKASSGTVASCN